MVLTSLLTLFIPLSFCIGIFFIVYFYKGSKTEFKELNLCTLSQKTSRHYLIQTPLFVSAFLVPLLMYIFTKEKVFGTYLTFLNQLLWLGVGFCLLALGFSVFLNGVSRLHPFFGYSLVFVFFSAVYTYFFIFLFQSILFSIFGLLLTTLYLLILITLIKQNNFKTNLKIQIFLIVGMCVFLFIALFKYLL